ncbi:hypothetical protein CBR_g27900 [Chara braunii]|uniref:Photosystem I reaction center subunit XI, chloroplastic n=1 Tax=Chara braunii TaxID=69332 RepID=A0A388L8Q1_CHABU|nr:hypothetical protein CBR_g27900 [Chara braunii]|eukprot:GBG78677.1 hypothetical protein CBR_g27900 [Chara braunii]
MAATTLAAVAAANSAILSAPIASSARRERSFSSAQVNRAFFGKGLGFVPSSQQLSLTRTTDAFVVRAAKKDETSVIAPLNGDPFIGMLETPVTSSPLVGWFLSNLPAYQTSVNPLLRGVEVGLAHGYLLVGPFVRLGPLRNTDLALSSGSAAAAGLVVILSVCLSMYGIVTFPEGASSGGLKTLTLTGREKEADKLQSADGWAGFTGGFIFGGLSGVAWAYFLLNNIQYPL